MKALGRHILVEFNGCNAEIMNDVGIIEKAMVDAANKAGATVINSTFHHFSPFGVSGVVVIQESHLAIHTWPEYGYAAVDLFTCGDTVDPWISFDHLKKVFQATNHSALEMGRGSLSLMKRIDFKVKDQRQQFEEVLKNPKMDRNLWFTDKDANQALSLRYTGDILFRETTPFQSVSVYETAAYGKMLAINNMVMCTERDEYHYHEMIVHPAMQLHSNPKNILVIGGGDGGTIREVLKYDSVEKVTMVEIDEAVVRASKQWLPQISKEFSNPKLDLKIADGIQFVKDSPANTYDLIIVDGSDPVGPAEGLFTEEFFKNCSKALKADGILTAQGESPMFQTKAFKELHGCFAKVFGASQVHPMLFFQPTYPSGMWCVQMCIKGSKHPVADFNASKAADFSNKKGLNYYNSDLHSAAFMLPTFVKKLLSV